MRCVTTSQMKAIDRRAIEELGIPSLDLMEHAAEHVTAAVLQEVNGIQEPTVLVFCGTGNNGGDGLACARQLMNAGVQVKTYLIGNPDKRTPDAVVNSDRLTAQGGVLLTWQDAGNLQAHCIVDALFGFGLNREVGGVYRQVIEWINGSGIPVISCDIPSGLNGDTGAVMGAAVRAENTVSFTCAKAGLLAPGAEEYVGRLTVADIGIPEILLG